MQLFDFHIHSICSDDAKNTMAEMALASAKAGIDVVCFTDHFDLDDYRTGEPLLNPLDIWPTVLEQYAAAKEACAGIVEVRLGMELGEANHNPTYAARCAAQPELDFVLGSTHNLRNTTDFYYLQYQSLEHCYALLDTYIAELMELSQLDCYDCMSHIGYTRRYMLAAGYDAVITLDRYGDQLDQIFRTLIQNGRGIELNCSGFRHPGISTSIPDLPLLKRYRELGGEIITIGTDAHRVVDAGHFIREGYALLAEAGFQYVCSYQNRIPAFIKLDRL
ncbi:MAG: histidinol-phosphatase HisJ family protein [Oscillospiraceae bacterium]